MVGLMVITGVMVTITMMAAIITAREVEALKTEVNNLEAIQEETLQRLEEVLRYRESIQGTLHMLKQVRLGKIERGKNLNEELETLEQEAVEERDISMSRPLQKPSDEGFDS
jgi:hypothetical protein